MKSRRRNCILTATAIVALASFTACGSDDSTGPGGIDFPDIDPQVTALLCIRGQVTAGETVSGTLTSGDCDSADFTPGDDSYFESWHVRVSETRSVTFDAQSGFDNYLEIYRLDNAHPDSLEVTLIAENDDRNFPDDLNALVTVTLQPGQDYGLVVSGFDYSETGPYQVHIQ